MNPSSGVLADSKKHGGYPGLKRQVTNRRLSPKKGGEERERTTNSTLPPVPFLEEVSPKSKQHFRVERRAKPAGGANKKLAFNPSMLNHAKPFSLDRLLNEDANCDVQVFHDGLEFLEFSASNNYPTTTVFLPAYQQIPNFEREVATFAMDVLQVRIGGCRISLIFNGHWNVADFLATGRVQDRNWFDIPSRFSLQLNKKRVESRVTIIVVEHSKWIQRLETGSIELCLYFYNLFREYIPTFIMAFPVAGYEIELCWMRSTDFEVSFLCTKKANQSLADVNLIAVSPNNSCWKIFHRYEDRQLAKSYEPTQNPFDQIENLTNIAKFVFRQVLQSANETECSTVEPVYIVNVVAKYHSSTSNIQVFVDKRVTITFDGYKFLTCHTSTFLTFEFYLTPFQLDLWICLLICLTVVVSCLTLYTRYCDTGTSDGIRWISPWLNVLSTLFEEPASVPSILEKRAFYRLVFGSWALMAVFKTNCYNGIMITNLNAPLPGIKIEEWNDIVCDRVAGGVNMSHKEITAWANKTGISKYWGNAFNIRYPVYGQNYGSKKLTNPFESENCFRLLSPISSNPYYRRPNLPANRFFYFEFEKYQNLDNYIMNHYLNEELNEMITKEILKCGKTVWIGDSDEVAQEYFYLREQYPWIRWQRSKDVLKPEMSGMTFSNNGESKIPQYFQGIIESGIWARLEQEKSSKYLRGRLKSVDVDKVSPIALNGSILTLFVLCGFLIVWALVCIGCEFRSTIWFIIKTIGKEMRWKVRNTFNFLVYKETVTSDKCARRNNRLWR
ncbi:hypothetical protein Fcan01_22950 [Folsomia candida]|uniref:Uncharacterized protein n=1 Tax=Folsomia candida TaxID=158441 RepID=A0A226DBY8_FOLCA|nr:hypothetical protein Fcan01_22950 [Folsomia candida]